MDGMLHLRPEERGESRPGPMFGILYAEDFDELPPPPPTYEPDMAVEPTSPVLTQDDVDSAALEAVVRARAVWQNDAEQQRQRALSAIAETLTAARTEAERAAADLAEATVTTMLATLSGALPHLCREHGPAEARALVQQLLPYLRAEPRVSIRAHPSVAPILEQDLAEIDLELAGAVTVTPAPLEPGDLRVTWENGSFKRDTAAVLIAVRDALAQLGLIAPIQITPERRMALAE